jgi:hypothetical protein
MTNTETTGAVPNDGSNPSAARPAESAATRGEEMPNTRQFGDLLRRKPGLAALFVGGIGFVAANALGVGEFAVAMVAAYGAYKWLNEPR